MLQNSFYQIVLVYYLLYTKQTNEKGVLLTFLAISHQSLIYHGVFF